MRKIKIKKRNKGHQASVLGLELTGILKHFYGRYFIILQDLLRRGADAN
jgi:hypothetical protein